MLFLKSTSNGWFAVLFELIHDSIMNDLNSRATMIMGAGAVMDMNFPCGVLRPSTWNITQEVIKPYDNVFDKNKEITVVGEIYYRLMKVFPVNTISGGKTT